MPSTTNSVKSTRTIITGKKGKSETILRIHLHQGIVFFKAMDDPHNNSALVHEGISEASTFFNATYVNDVSLSVVVG